MTNSVCLAAVAEYFAALRAMDIERWVNTFAPDAVSYDPVGMPPHVGHAALRSFVTGALAGFTSFGLTEDQVFAADLSAAVKWTGHGVARNGAQITFEGVDVIDCDAAGKITMVRAFWDPGSAFKALG